MSGPPPRIVLASASAARRQMLASAGVLVEIQPAQIDEESIKAGQLEHTKSTPQDIVVRLAVAKAEAVSALRPNDLVVGSDQVLAFESELLSKPADLQAARSQLETLRGKTHKLYAAVAIAVNGRSVWSEFRMASLTMRNFSDAFLENYLENEKDWVCQCVGSYRIEGPGIHLFEEIDGNHFTILGMPLLGLLSELRRRGAIAL